MKLKFANSLLVAALVVTAAGCFTSCKDTDEDMYNNLEDKYLTLLGGNVGDGVKNLQEISDELKEIQNYLNLNDEGVNGGLSTALAGQIQEYLDNKNYLTAEELAAKGYLTEDQVKALIQQYAAQCACAEQIASLQSQIKEISDAINGVKGDKTVAEFFVEVQNAITNVQTLQKQLENYATKAELADSTKAVKNLISALDARVSALEPVVANNTLRLDTLYANVEEAYLQIQATQEFMTQLRNELKNDDAELEARLDSLIGLNTQGIEDLKTALAQQKTDLEAAIKKANDETVEYITEVYNQLGQAVGNLANRLDDVDITIADMQSVIDTYNTRITTLEGEVSTLTTNVNNLLSQMPEILKRLDNQDMRLYSLIVNQVSSPIIGSLSAPIDVQTMVLFNYYGLNEGVDAVFPNFQATKEVNFGYRTVSADRNGLISEAQQNLLGVVPEVAEKSGESFLANDGNFGSVYFTANPANINLASGYNFSLVNSLGEEAPLQLVNPVKDANHLILFGNSRATATGDVALWRADAKLEPGNIPSMRVDVEPGLKSAIKDMVQDRTINSGLKVAAKVYQTVTNNSSLPAYGLKAAWTDLDGKQQSCYAQYNMAAATFRPLSFSLLYDQDLSGKLPNIPSFDDLLGDLSFDFGTINLDLKVEPVEIDGVTVDITDIEIPFNFDEISGSVTLNFNVTAYGEYDYPTEIDPVTGEVIASVKKELEVVVPVNKEVPVESIDQIKTEIANALKETEKQINLKFEDLRNITGQINDMVDQIQTQINDIMDSISEQVNSALSDVLGDLQKEVNGKIEDVTERIRPFYDKFESLTNRIENVLKDPNHYMQVFMMYKSGNSMGRLSTSSVVPSIWKSSNGNGYATLVPTTYNADLLSPSYRKYVAVTNVYKEDNRSVSAANGDAECIKLLKAANNGQYMDKAISGERKTVEFDFNGAVGKNYTYEIFYQALDFRGHYSTGKYYVNVK